jgi:hypothetical protein
MSGKGDDQRVKFAGSELNVGGTETHRTNRTTQLCCVQNDEVDPLAGSPKMLPWAGEQTQVRPFDTCRSAVSTPTISNLACGGVALDILKCLVGNSNIAPTIRCLHVFDANLAAGVDIALPTSELLP